MEMFILIYLSGAMIASFLYGLDYLLKTPPIGGVVLCFFLWWFVLYLQVALWLVRLGQLFRKKYITNRG